MSKKVIYKITRKKFEIIEVETEAEEMAIIVANKDFERFDKQQQRARARNSSIDGLIEKGLEIADSKSSIEDIYIEEENYEQLKKRVRSAIATLTDRQKEMVTMVFYEGKSQEELAEYYGITKQAVSNAMQRIYATLKRFLEKS